MRAQFRCKVITPMFMAGADGRTPELRPSEFKGMMRFWWRAIRAESDIKKLKEEEAKIFGGTGEKEGKSKVRIIVIVIPKNIQTSSYRPLPHKTFTFPCINVNSEFEVILETMYEELQEFFKNLFLLSAILGGFGKRSRRGFGSISVESEEYRNLRLENIKNMLNKISNYYQLEGSKIVNTKSGGNYPWIKKIEIGKEYQSWEDLVKKIGQASHNHRDPSLGNASPRMASPIYVSVIKIGGKYHPIITTLNSYFPHDGYPSWNFNQQQEQDFKQEILL